MAQSLTKRTGVLLVVFAVIVGSVPVLTLEVDATSIQNPTDNISDDQIFEGSDDGQVEVWNRAAYPIRTNDSGAPTQVNYPVILQGQRLDDNGQFDSTNNGGKSKDLNPASFNGQRNPAGVHNPGNISISFNGNRGGTNDLANQENVTFLAANVTGEGGDGVPADYSSAVDILSDVDNANANATFQKKPNASLDSNGETSFTADFGEGYHIIFASVRQDANAGYQVDSERNISIDGDVVIVGVEGVAVQKDKASVDNISPGNPNPGDTIDFDIDTSSAFDSNADVTHTVALYEKGTFEDSRVDIVTNESKFGPNFNLSNGSQVEHSIESATGVADVEDGIEINGVDLSDGRVARSVGMGAIIDQIAEDFTTNDPQTDPIVQGGSSSSKTEEIFASVRAVSGKNPDTTVSVETFENFSTVEYQYIVYSQLDNDATKFSTASGTVTIESESGGGGDEGGGTTGGGGGGGGGGGAIEEQVETTVESTKQETEGGETATATIPDAEAGETVSVNTDTSSDDGAVTVDSVNIEFAEETGEANVQVSTTSANNPPEGAPEPDPGQTGDAIGYVETTVEGADDNSIGRSTFNFRVSDQRLEQTGTSPENVVLYRVVDGEPTPLPTEHRGGNSFVAETDGFSVFVIGTTGVDISVASGELDATTVDPGEAFTASVTLRNDGGSAGDVELTLAADGDTLATQTVTVAPEEQTQVDLTGSIDQAGTYDITVNGNSIGTLEVVEEGEAGTPEGTATPGPGEEPGEESGEGTPAAEGTPTPETDGVFGPGFGIIVALLALLGASLIALRRRQ